MRGTAEVHPGLPPLGVLGRFAAKYYLSAADCAASFLTPTDGSSAPATTPSPKPSGSPSTPPPQSSSPDRRLRHPRERRPHPALVTDEAHLFRPGPESGSRLGEAWGEQLGQLLGHAAEVVDPDDLDADGSLAAPEPGEALAGVELLDRAPRAKILRSLDRAAPAGQIARALRLSPSTVTHHLAALEAAGLIIREATGRHVLAHRTARGTALLDLYEE